MNATDLHIDRAHIDGTFRRDVEDCLRRLGVAAFADRKVAWRHGRIIPLIWMIAFEVGATTWAEAITLPGLAVAAGIITVLSFLAGPLSVDALGINEKPTHGWWLLPMLILVPVASLHFLRDQVWPVHQDDLMWTWPMVWSDAAIVLAALYAFAVLLLWQDERSSGRHVILLWTLLASCSAAIVVSAGTYPVDLPVGDYPGHNSLPALVVATVLLAMALAVPRLRVNEALPGRSPDRPGYAARLAVPTALLVLTFGLTNGFLLYFVDRLPVPLTILTLVVVGGTVLTARRWPPSGSGPTPTGTASPGTRKPFDRLRRPHPGDVAAPRARWWVLALLTVYPVLYWRFLSNVPVEGFGWTWTGLGAVLALAFFNLAFASFVFILVYLGLDHLLWWALREAWQKKGDTIRQLAGAAPLLMIFVAFFGLTAETWQIVHKLEWWELQALLGLLLLLVVLLIAGWSVALLKRERTFYSWSHVRTVLAGCPEDRDFKSVARRLSGFLSTRLPSDQPPTKLKWAASLNALLVLFVYQSFSLAAIALCLFLVLLLLTKLAVPPEVAAEWIFGDGQSGRAGELATLSWYDLGRLFMLDGRALASPWMRVALLLTLFSVLYFAAQSLATEQSRWQYFNMVDVAMRRRFAVRLGHQWAVKPPDLTAPVGAAAVTDGSDGPSGRGDRAATERSEAVPPGRVALEP